MKKLFYIFLLAFCCPSCNILDVTPENQVTYTNYFSTEQELESITTQMHSFIRMYLTHWDWPYHEHAGALADETDEYIGNIKQFDPSEFDTYSPVGNWKEWYDIIYVANVMLDNIHRAQDNVTEDRIGFHTGQACFGKGLAYFYIVRHFGDAVITKNSTHMESYGNTPALTILDTVIANGMRAYKLLPRHGDLVDRNGTAITSKQYGSKGSAAALLAHAYAWKGSIIDLYGLDGDSRDCYEQSVAWATKIIGGEAGTYALEDPETRCQAWSVPGKENPESIFEIELDKVSSGYLLYSGYGINYITWPVNKKMTKGEITTHKLRIYRSTVSQMYRGNDTRKNAFFYDPKPEDEVSQTTYAYPWKWRNGLYQSADGNEEEWQTIDANTVVWRLADILLLRAECNTKLGNDGPAEADLNAVRSKANADLYPTAGENDLKKAIFDEREKELIFEGHRYFDIIRNGEAYILDKLEGGQSGVVNHASIQEGILYYPISSDAFTLNEKLRQNVYWAKHKY